jgi:DNA-binding NarL/FixJ family response regulator
MTGDRTIRVVLVDDEEDLRFMLRLHFNQDARFDIVAEASDGEEGLKICEELKPDLIVLDVKMPRMDGLTAMPLMRKVCPDTKVVLFTAFADLVDQEVVRSHDAMVMEKDAPLPWLADQLFEFTTA